MDEGNTIMWENKPIKHECIKSKSDYYLYIPLLAWGVPVEESNILPQTLNPSYVNLLAISFPQSAAGHWRHLICTNFSICLSYIKASYRKSTSVLCLQGTHLWSLQVLLFYLPALSCSSRSSSCSAMYTVAHRWHLLSFKTRAEV